VSLSNGTKIVLRKITNTKQRSKRTPIEISGFFFVEILIVRWFRWDFVWKKGVLRIKIIQIKMRKDDKVDIRYVTHKESRQISNDTGWRGFGMWITYLCKRLCIMDLCVYSYC
jgi:hypothetical protein